MGEIDETFRPRSVPWTIAISVVSLGFYVPIWLGLTWSEMKRELRDDGMTPVWHGLAAFVPVYDLYRLHAHFTCINRTLGRAPNVPSARAKRVVLAAGVAAIVVGPGYLPLFALIWQVPPRLGLGSPVIWALIGFYAPIISGLIVFGAIAGYGQAALNRYWLSALPDTPRQAGALGWVIVYLLAVVWIGTIVSTFVTFASVTASVWILIATSQAFLVGVIVALVLASLRFVSRGRAG
jgi:hypothetical protein